MMPTPADEIRRVIEKWEGLFTANPDDAGNWLNGRLVGTMRGVTGATLAAHRRMPPEAMTQEIVRSVTLDEAVEVGVERFYRGYRIDTLPWGPATAILLDFCWGSGSWGIRMVQRLIGVNEDGGIGPDTRAAYVRWIQRLGWEGAVREIVAIRRKFYTDISMPGTPNHQFRAGWYNRCDWQSPSNGGWWRPWVEAMPPVPHAAPTGARPGATARPAAVPVAPPPPATMTEAVAAAAAGKSGVAVVGGVGLPTAGAVLVAIDQTKEVVESGKGLLATLGLDLRVVVIVAGVVVLFFVGAWTWRYAGKLRRGEAVST